MAGAGLKGNELQDALRSLTGWRVVDEHHLVKDFRFPNFATALAFVNRIGERAEAANHHPDLTLGWGRVGIELWSHDINAISERDIKLAAEIDRIPRS